MENDQTPLKIGDEVISTLKPSSGLPLLVTGELHYSDGKDPIVMVSSTTVVGMPISASWLRTTGRQDLESATAFREQYLSRYGQHWLKPAEA